MGYLGAKSGSGVYQAIINLMPPHDTYIEPFLGTGAIMARKAAATQSTGLDLNEDAIRDFACDYPVETLCTDALEWLSGFSAADRTLIYCDPPYLHSTRSSNKRYRHELSDNDHADLIGLLTDQARDEQVNIMISGYRNKLYEQKLSSWYSCDFQAMSRGGVRTETLWCSFEPGEIHYHSFAGANFTDRQRIQRKAQRWANNFSRMPPGERQAILAAILAVD